METGHMQVGAKQAQIAAMKAAQAKRAGSARPDDQTDIPPALRRGHAQCVVKPGPVAVVAKAPPKPADKPAEPVEEKTTPPLLSTPPEHKTTTAPASEPPQATGTETKESVMKTATAKKPSTKGKKTAKSSARRPAGKKTAARSAARAPKADKAPKQPKGMVVEILKLSSRENGVSPAELNKLTEWKGAPWKWLFSNPKKTGYCDRWGYTFKVIEGKEGETRYSTTKKV